MLQISTELINVQESQMALREPPYLGGRDPPWLVRAACVDVKMVELHTKPTRGKINK